MSGLTVATFRVPAQLLTPGGAVPDNVPQPLEVSGGLHLYRLTEPLGRMPVISSVDRGYWVGRYNSLFHTVSYVSRVGWELTNRAREVFLGPSNYMGMHCLVLMRNPIQADTEYLVAKLNEQDQALRRAAYLSSERGMFFGDREPV